MLLAVVLAVPGASAPAQYNYPPGYAPWLGGVGRCRVDGRGEHRHGMGNFAAGAGSYNVQTAQARSMNANTAMQVNDYMYPVNQRNAANEMAKLAGRAAMRRQRGHVRQAHRPPRLRHHTATPERGPRRAGQPKVYTQVVQKATPPIDSQLVKNINFQHAPDMIVISLDDLSARGVPDALATDPAFEADRRAIRALVAKVRQEAEGENQVSIETLREARMAVKAVQEKVAAVPQGTKDRDEADNFLKALYGLTRCSRTRRRAVPQGPEPVPDDDLGHLITFLLQLGLTPIRPTTTSSTTLVGLRDGSKAQGPNPTAQAPSRTRSR